MKIARKPRPFRDLDVSSFSDIAFLLIIFFILTTTFSRPMGLAVTIPSSTQDETRKAEEDYPTVTLSAGGLQFREQDTTIEELRQSLFGMKLAERPEEQRFVVVESAPDVDYDRYYQVVTAIARAGGVLALIESAEEEGGGAAPAPAAGTNAPPAGGTS